MAALIVLLVVALFVLIVLARTVRIIPQARAGVVERLGRYSRTLDAGLTIIVPFVDRLRPLIDLREQVVSFRPQPVITEDNLVVSIDSVIYFQVTDPKAASYEIANYIQAIDPPATIQEAMEKQMRADRDKRAAILNAEGVKQSQILTAEGEKQSAILRAEGAKQAQILGAEGQAKAIENVAASIHAANVDPKLLAYQYLQMLPQIAQGDPKKAWIIPSEFAKAAGGIGQALGIAESENESEPSRTDAGTKALPEETTET